jgi:hypothetical protein
MSRQVIFRLAAAAHGVDGKGMTRLIRRAARILVLSGSECNPPRGLIAACLARF